MKYRKMALTLLIAAGIVAAGFAWVGLSRYVFDDYRDRVEAVPAEEGAFYLEYRESGAEWPWELLPDDAVPVSAARSGAAEMPGGYLDDLEEHGLDGSGSGQDLEQNVSVLLAAISDVIPRDGLDHLEECTYVVIVDESEEGGLLWTGEKLIFVKDLPLTDEATGADCTVNIVLSDTGVLFYQCVRDHETENDYNTLNEAYEYLSGSYDAFCRMADMDMADMDMTAIMAPADAAEQDAASEQAVPDSAGNAFLDLVYRTEAFQPWTFYDMIASGRHSGIISDGEMMRIEFYDEDLQLTLFFDPAELQFAGFGISYVEES